MQASGLISVKLQGTEYEIAQGTTVGELLETYAKPAEQPALAGIAHNRCVDLSFPLTTDTDVSPVDYTSRLGVLVYRRTASLMLLEAVRQLFGHTRVKIDQALSNGYFYQIRVPGGMDRDKAAQLEERMKELAKQDLPLVTKEVTLAEARRIFSDRSVSSVELLLATRWQTYITLVFCGEFCTLHHFPVAPRTGCIDSFQIVPEPGGVVLRFPPRGRPQPVAPFVESGKLIEVYRESSRQLELLGVQTVGDLNKHVLNGEAGDIVRVAEGLHEKRVAQIADQICSHQDDVKLILIAGPSSSGKTTFSKRLGLQLRVNGVRPVGLSCDDFYVNREHTPLDEEGKYDFEAIEAIDLKLFNDTVVRLLKGEEVYTPRFDFTTGSRRPKEKWKPLRLEEGQVLVVEGIHGLNPRLTEAVPKQQKFEIYINALTQLCVDNHYRIYTSDTRLIRRIVRDRMFRGYSTAQTLEHWPKVRRGEMRNIYPFQDEADVMFDSALPYEHGVLRLYVERFLMEVPKDHPMFVDAFRLLPYVTSFAPIFDEAIPQTSLLCEFIGGSYFTY